jgi:hypothetical protein
MWVTATELPTGGSHRFYRHLNQLLGEHGCDGFVDGQCVQFYVEKMGRPGLPPGIYFRLLLIGYLRAQPSGLKEIVLGCRTSAAPLRTWEGNHDVRASFGRPKLLAEADRLAWLRVWTRAEPLYAKAREGFIANRDQRNALYVEVSRLRGQLPTLAVPEVSERLSEYLDNPRYAATSGFGWANNCSSPGCSGNSHICNCRVAGALRLPN